MYIYHHDNQSTEIIFSSNKIKQLVNELNNALEAKGVNLDYNKTGHHEEGMKFDITPVHGSDGNVCGHTIIRIWHAQWMSAVGNRVATDSQKFWEFVNEHGIMSLFYQYISEDDLAIYVANIMAPTLSECVSNIANAMRDLSVAHAPDKSNWIKHIIDPTTNLQPTIFNHGTGEYDKFENEKLSIEQTISTLYPNGIRYRQPIKSINIA